MGEFCRAVTYATSADPRHGICCNRSLDGGELSKAQFAALVSERIASLGILLA
jgi:hypothetical protein